jgi:hypothetical protein
LFSQSPVQQSLPCWQVLPTVRQVVQVPFWQKPLQQSLVFVHPL